VIGRFMRTIQEYQHDVPPWFPTGIGGLRRRDAPSGALQLKRTPSRPPPTDPPRRRPGSIPEPLHIHYALRHLKLDPGRRREGTVDVASARAEATDSAAEPRKLSPPPPPAI